VVRTYLTGQFDPPATGLYTLHIENTRSLASSMELHNHIDDISLVPADSNFGTDRLNIECETGALLKLNLHPGSAFAGKDYWIWMSITGNHPGFSVSGQHVSLNMGPLFNFGLMNPNFGGSVSFLGKIKSDGKALAMLFLPADPQHLLVGYPIHFAYVLTSPGPALPISAVSNPLHVKYIP
jgi:hypothetical protein